MKKHSPEYKAYLNSAAWLEFRERVKADRGNACEHCGVHGYEAVLQVHHLTYVRLGREWLKDVELLCAETCHPVADEKRRKQWHKGKKIHVRKKKAKRRR